MIVLGIILLICGFVFKISILWTIGIILLVIGVVLGLWGRWDTPSAAAATISSRPTATTRLIRIDGARNAKITRARFTTRPSGQPGSHYQRRQT